MLLDHLLTVSHDHHDHHDHVFTSFNPYPNTKVYPATSQGWLVDNTKAGLQNLFYGNWHFGGSNHKGDSGVWHPPPENNYGTGKYHEYDSDIDSGYGNSLSEDPGADNDPLAQGATGNEADPLAGFKQTVLGVGNMLDGLTYFFTF